GSPERATLKRTLDEMAKSPVEIPLVIDGKDVHTRARGEVKAPHNHRLALGNFHQAGVEHARAAVASALAAHRAWGEMSARERLAIFLRAADLLATKFRATENAATMLGQSKTVFQAEIDAACESIDFWRWNVHFAERIAAEQPISPPGQWNELDPRPL